MNFYTSNFKLKYCLSLIIITAVFISLLVSFNYFVDPFGIVSNKLPINNTVIKSNRLLALSIARNLDHAGVIVGSSMTENFKPSTFEKLWGFPFAKLSMSGSYFEEQTLILKEDFKLRDLKAVVWGLDQEFFRQVIGRIRTEQGEFPFWALERKFLPLWQNYYLTLDPLVRYFKEQIGSDKTKGLDQDKLHYWGEGHIYGCKNKALVHQLEQVVINGVDKSPSDDEKKLYKQNIEKYLLSLVKQYPKTIFYFFLPPFSVWEQVKIRESLIEIRSLLVEILSPYENAKIYDFQQDKNIIININNYKDLIHYSHLISEDLAHRMHEAPVNFSREHHQYLRSFKLENSNPCNSIN